MSDTNEPPKKLISRPGLSTLKASGSTTKQKQEDVQPSPQGPAKVYDINEPRDKPTSRPGLSTLRSQMKQKDAGHTQEPNPALADAGSSGPKEPRDELTWSPGLSSLPGGTHKRDTKQERLSPTEELIKKIRRARDNADDSMHILEKAINKDGCFDVAKMREALNDCKALAAELVAPKSYEMESAEAKLREVLDKHNAVAEKIRTKMREAMRE